MTNTPRDKYHCLSQHSTSPPSTLARKNTSSDPNIHIVMIHDTTCGEETQSNVIQDQCG